MDKKYFYEAYHRMRVIANYYVEKLYGKHARIGGNMDIGQDFIKFEVGDSNGGNGIYEDFPTYLIFEENWQETADALIEVALHQRRTDEEKRKEQKAELDIQKEEDGRNLSYNDYVKKYNIL